MTIREIEPDKGKLDLPGGFLHLGEHPEAAAKREIKEEIGIDIAVTSFLGFAVDQYFYQGYWETTLSAAYLAKVVSGQPHVADPNEISALKWIDPHDYNPKELAFACNEQFLNVIASHAIRKRHCEP